MLVALKKLFWYHKDEEDEDYEKNKQKANEAFQASMMSAVNSAMKTKQIAHNLDKIDAGKTNNILEDVFNDIGNFN